MIATNRIAVKKYIEMLIYLFFQSKNSDRKAIFSVKIKQKWWKSKNGVNKI